MPKYINTKDELKKCLEIELKGYSCGFLNYFPILISERQAVRKIIYNLRHYEYHLNSKHKVRTLFYKIKTGYWENRTCVRIPPNVIDIGLSIGHVGPIIINEFCVIGKNFRVHVGVNIGANGGEPPKLGDNVYIGPGAKLFGDIIIADGCSIGANAVVNKSCLDKNSVLVGVPAHVVGSKKRI